MDNNISITFGTPEHGWLPVDLSSNDYKLSIDVSDVPINPLEDLCNVLQDVTKGHKSEVYWNLEPVAVFFEFEKSGKEYQLSISQAADNRSFRETKKIIKGSFQEIIFPFINCTTKFYSQTYDEKHWPTVDKRKLDKLITLTAYT